MSVHFTESGAGMWCIGWGGREYFITDDDAHVLCRALLAKLGNELPDAVSFGVNLGIALASQVIERAGGLSDEQKTMLISTIKTEWRTIFATVAALPIPG